MSPRHNNGPIAQGGGHGVGGGHGLQTALFGFKGGVPSQSSPRNNNGPVAVGSGQMYAGQE